MNIIKTIQAVVVQDMNMLVAADMDIQVEDAININVINKYLYNYAVINSESLTISFKKDFFKTQQMLFTAIREFLKVDYFYNDSNKKMTLIR